MAVTVTLSALALALRVTVRAGGPIDDGRRDILTGLLAVCTAQVDGYAPEAPPETANEAVKRMAGYMFDVAPGGGRSMEAPNAFILSGARALMARFYVPKPARVTI